MILHKKKSLKITKVALSPIESAASSRPSVFQSEQILRIAPLSDLTLRVSRHLEKYTDRWKNNLHLRKNGAF